MLSDIRIATLSAGLSLFAATAAPALAADAAPPAPKKVAILIFDGVEVIDYSGPYEVFADAGYDVFTVAATKSPITTAAGDGMKIMPKYDFADAPQADLVLIPGGDVGAVSKNEAALDWIKRETVHVQHTMSVCNGAFTLANTGLLDGLSATTTAGNIVRMSHEYPKIKVVNDQRFVDNGKIVTTAGLSAGIDGALHMLDVMEGAGSAQTVAFMLEYDWHPTGGFVRGVMADRLIPRIDTDTLGDTTDFSLKGDRDHWEIDRRLATKLSATELLGAIETKYQKAYQADGEWRAGSFQVASSSPNEADLRYDDREGHHWRGALTVAPSAGDAHQFVVGLVTNRID
jgi:putative intracellular protease/amidase